ncbi:hypothetical protein ElyMa_002974600 [Elysia marginata]|uniref:Uncharacterized protein n=1 Tax=Elysia marginata TaxID=1093978 RepID=A0AAV4ICM8_9GAST|nr:hypothetical protein ElyMa_002974600 [Elysia marginata]
MKNLSLQTKNCQLKSKVRKLKRKLRDRGKEPKGRKANEKSNARVEEEQKEDNRAEPEIEEFQDNILEVVTRRVDGFTTQTRFCELELAGSEAATARIGPVMETVSELCGVKLTSVPSRSACQMIIDGGQALAQAFIREKVLKRSLHFGIHKDGTTRNKRKILDTSLTTDSGLGYFLGWSAVASETGEAIAQETKKKLDEVSESAAETKDGVTVEILNKLEFYMNDRAASERKSNGLLDEWRDDMLKEYGEGAPQVQHLYCAAYVLLGFHSYELTALKDVTDLPQNEQTHPIMVMLRDASDLFGPVGDYRGLRNQWEALVIRDGMKSWIGAYKDNRLIINNNNILNLYTAYP